MYVNEFGEICQVYAIIIVVFLSGVKKPFSPPACLLMMGCVALAGRGRRDRGVFIFLGDLGVLGGKKSKLYPNQFFTISEQVLAILRIDPVWITDQA
jgi:hypothetical protein